MSLLNPGVPARVAYDHTESIPYIEVKDDAGAFVYYGRARAQGAANIAAADPVWQIYRVNSAGTLLSPAQGSAAFSHAWANRASLSYPGVA